MSAAVDRIREEITELKTVNTSIKTLLTRLSQQIRDNAEDPVALNALADDLDAQNAEMTQAVTDNTPAA